jgi:hypothetical protein
LPFDPPSQAPFIACKSKDARIFTRADPRATRIRASAKLKATVENRVEPGVDRAAEDA